MNRLVLRLARIPDDLAALQKLSPPSIKPEAEFFAYPTLVAEIDGEIAGYTQWSLGPDKTLHSLAIRIGAQWKGRGLGQALMEEKCRLAREAGARRHMYAIAKDGEEALKKIVTKLGMHLCQTLGEVYLYVGHFDDETR